MPIPFMSPYADEAYCVGPAPSSQSYLNIPNIISGPHLRPTPSIWLWYLAERPFAEICRANGLAFIGPSPETERMGDKAAAKRPWRGGRAVILEVRAV